MQELRRNFANTSSADRAERQATLAKAYLRGYIKAKNEGDVSEAMRLLQKANAAAHFVHVWMPNRAAGGQEDLVPLRAIVPSFSYDQDASPNFILPATIDSWEEEHAEEPESVVAPLGVPKPLIVPFSGNHGDGW